ncbi:MAG: thiamine/thiamine pyrophosphate ABC transporter permease [Granulosicoccaceae bacterium]
MCRTPPYKPPWWLPGALSVLAVVALVGLPLLALVNEASNIELLDTISDPYHQRVINFSLYQAVLSTLFSVVLATPLAVALSREPRFKGRDLLINLFSLSLVIPTIVAIVGIVSVFGQAGLVNHWLQTLGLPSFSIYGLHGILLAHVFFNTPLAARVLLQSLENIPQEQWRLAAQLGLPSNSRWRFIEWPAIRPQLVGIAILIFALCFTSFTIVMTLGGGPRATTIEVAIYQALRFDFDINTAVALALIQLALCSLIMIATHSFGMQTSQGLSEIKLNPSTHYSSSHCLNGLIIGIAALFLITPLASLVVKAFNPATLTVIAHSKTLSALTNSVVVALTAGALAVSMGIGLQLSARHLRLRLNKRSSGKAIQLAGNIILVIPPVVLGTGLFILLRPFADVFALALALVIAINSLMALPFVLRILEGPVLQAAQRHDRLIQSLGIHGLPRWRLLDWPHLKKPIGYSMAIASTLAAGDLSAIALFGSERITTLPLLLYQRMGSYRHYEALTTAVLLLLLCLALFFVLQRVIGGKPDA